MKLVSWNVNGLRAVRKKGFDEVLTNLDADIICLQETKLQEHQLELPESDYHRVFSYAERKGYSGTGVLTKSEPLSVAHSIGHELDSEGRTVTCEYPDFYLVCCYTPNSQRDLARLDLRMDWDKSFRSYLTQLDKKKPVIVCGDLNVAHNEIDIKNPDTNHKSAGFSDEERASFTATLNEGFTDTFRALHPDTVKYSWWSYMRRSRDRNIGWRLDYWLCSNRLFSRVEDSDILVDIMGSDHAPVTLTLK